MIAGARPWVVLRCRNDMPLLAQTLAMVARQTVRSQLLAFDDGSTDGSLEVLRAHADRVLPVPGGHYVPGRVLNEGMARSGGDVVVFLNSDCTPRDERWLERLLEGFTHDRVAAAFGRQVARPGCLPYYARETEDTFGAGDRQCRWRHCFSMASSAVRRSVWERLPFDETLRYSEDIDWTWRARQAGWEIVYAPQSAAWHSHNYGLRQLYRRHRGEGRAEARIFDWTDWQRSLARYTLLPLGRQVARDWAYCLRRGQVGAILRAPVVRLVQATGRRRGFSDGWRERAEGVQ